MKDKKLALESYEVSRPEEQGYSLSGCPHYLRQKSNRTVMDIWRDLQSDYGSGMRNQLNEHSLHMGMRKYIKKNFPNVYSRKACTGEAASKELK